MFVSIPVKSLVSKKHFDWSIKKGGPASVVITPNGIDLRNPREYAGGVALITNAKPGIDFEWID